MSQSNHSFVITGLTRNCEKSVAKSIEVLSRAFASAKSVSWLVVESDSDDNTVGELERLSKTIPGFAFRSLGRLRDKLPKRTERISHCRNQAIEIIRNDPAYAQVDYVVLADLDGINTILNEDAVNTCFERDDWDACLANQAGPYYDMWALRHPIWAPNDYWEYFYFLMSLGLPRYQALQRAIYSHAITIPRTAPWIEVHSGFGGLALYRKSLYVECHYEGLDAAGKEICEHVPFSSQLRAKGAHLYINPRLLNAAKTEYTNQWVWRWQILKFYFGHLIGRC